MDYDPRHLAVGQRMAREVGVVNASLFAQDITAPFPFAAKTFDAVLFLDVIEHIHPRVAVLHEIHRVLRDDGRLLVSAPNRDTRWRRTLRDAGLFAYSDPDHKIEYTRGEFIAELRAGGFEVEGGLEPVVHDTPWAGAIDALGGVSLTAYDRLSRWRREAALRRPDDSTGFRARAVKAPPR
jgi:SAM-dependent methyltransferase